MPTSIYARSSHGLRIRLRVGHSQIARAEPATVASSARFAQYSVRPSQRRRSFGWASAMALLAIVICPEFAST
jgi:hypothetical protein